MKIKFILPVFAVVIAAFTACERELTISEAEFSDIGWLTSEFRNQEFTVGVNSFLTFTDLSVNAVEHTWTIIEGSAFLQGPLGTNDTILEPFIIPDAGLVSEEATVNVLFSEGGLKTVNLRNAFKDSVSYRTSMGNIPSRREGNLYVFDTTFTVDVYDTIVPIIDIRQNGVSVPFQDSTDVITIEAGDFLEFVDLSVKDRVTTRAWRVEENGSVGDSIGLFQFKKLGEFKAVADLTRSGENIPFDFERFEIPATFRVVPSSKPFVVSGDLVELEDETIQIPFNGEFAPFGSQEEFFTVTLQGDTPRELSIGSVSRNSADATILEIRLTEPIYRPDEITVSYAGGTLVSTDTRTPVEFTDLPVNMHDVNLLEGETAAIYDFEGAAAEIAWTENDQSSASSVEFTTERASSGTTSLKWTSESGSALRIQCEGERFSLPAGEYEISYDLFLEEGNTFAATVLTIFDPFDQKWTDARPPAVPRGQWVKITRNDFVIGADTDTAYLFLRTEGGEGTAFMDNWRIVPKEERP